MADKQYRIAWLLDGRQGYGQWGVDYDGAVATVASLNRKYGDRTHWVENK